MPTHKKHTGDSLQTPLEIVLDWFRRRMWEPFPFQLQVWQAYVKGQSGLIHAATGIGKTYAAWMGPIMEWMTDARWAGGETQDRDAPADLSVLWVTPLRALAKDTIEALQKPVTDLGVPWSIQIRTGDTPASLKSKQAKKLPTALITTPESLSLLLSYPQAKDLFRSLRTVVVDEWHELMGSKRGVQMELCLARLRTLHPRLKIWGLSATLGNTELAMETLLGSDSGEGLLVKGLIPKRTIIDSILPEAVERFPWAGHLGIRLLPQVIEHIEASKTSLVFTNTRSQTEIWYRAILEARPDWAGLLALHHGSLDKKSRTYVENALRRDELRCVVCTSSLDLGIDFSPVDKVIQIGSPKGIARMMQRAGRSGHQPNQISHITFVPTNAFELIELAALRRAIAEGFIEPRTPVELPLDVLCQHLVTLALGGGFAAEPVFQEVTRTYAFRNLSKDQFGWALDFITTGGPALRAYPEYARVARTNGRYRVDRQSIARRHRMTIGTITSDTAMQVKYANGNRLGTIEESFVSRLNKGDIFVFAGNTLRFERIKDMTLWVKKVKQRKGTVPQWLGGRMPLSTELCQAVRKQLNRVRNGILSGAEMVALKPLLDLQSRWSTIPAAEELLVETLKTREGFHLFFYPFEGHLVHEGLSALFAYRIIQRLPITLTMAVNDYGFELLSEREIAIDTALLTHLFNTDNLTHDMVRSVNASEMAKRQFRDIARIAGLVFQGYPGVQKNTRQVQASTGLIYNVFFRYDPENLFLKQAMQEVLDGQMEHRRLEKALRRMARCDIRMMRPPHPTPLGFPIMVNRMRAKVSSEKLADRIRRMHMRLEKAAGSFDK